MSIGLKDMTLQPPTRSESESAAYLQAWMGGLSRPELESVLAQMVEAGAKLRAQAMAEEAGAREEIEEMAERDDTSMVAHFIPYERFQAILDIISEYALDRDCYMLPEPGFAARLLGRYA